LSFLQILTLLLFSVSSYIYLAIQSDLNMPTAAKDIAGASGLTRMVSHSLSASPTAAFHSPPGSFGMSLSRTTTNTAAKQLKPFDTQDIKILLLENVNQSGKDILSGQGYQVEALKTSLPEDELIEKIRWD
jgi:D-3-phosphoglycerate dehydrogenase